MAVLRVGTAKKAYRMTVKEETKRKDGNGVILTPSSPFALHATIQVEARGDITCTDGPLPSKLRFSKTFTTRDVMRMTEATPNKDYLVPSQPLHQLCNFTFTNDICKKNGWTPDHRRDLVKVDPFLPELVVNDRNANQLVVQGKPKAGVE